METKFTVMNGKTIVLGKVITFDKKKMGINLSDEEIQKRINEDYEYFVSYDKELWIIFSFDSKEFNHIYWAFNLNGLRVLNATNIDNLKSLINNYKIGLIDAINNILKFSVKEDKDEKELIRALESIKNI